MLVGTMMILATLLTEVTRSERMFNDIQTLLIFWAMLFGFFVISSRGLGVVGDVLRPTGLFLLEKALGPAIDFAEGEAWLCLPNMDHHRVAMAVPVCLLHVPRGLGRTRPVCTDLVVRLGIHPKSSDTLISAGTVAGLYGFIGMVVIGASFHVLPLLCGTPGTA